MMTTPQAQPNPYLRTQVMTANPEELRLMLFDGAIRFGEHAKTSIEQNEPEGIFEGITRCQSILLELINSLRPENDEKLCENLSALYTFMFTRMIDASRASDPAIIEEVLNLLRYERETWLLLMDQLAKENRESANMGELPRPPAKPPANGSKPAMPANPPDIIGGSISLQG